MPVYIRWHVADKLPNVASEFYGAGLPGQENDVNDISRSVCVYCASSNGVDPAHMKVARHLGEMLAKKGCTVIYGGSRMGTMGALAEGALGSGGRVIGIMPGFLDRLEIAHGALSELRVVEDMRTRKHAMMASSSAVIGLPGGAGTLEELLEAITLRKLGVHAHPIILVNTNHFYEPLLELFAGTEREGFFPTPSRYFYVVDTPEEAIRRLEQEKFESEQ